MEEDVLIAAERQAQVLRSVGLPSAAALVERFRQELTRRPDADGDTQPRG
jgi:hypothetical protein